MINAWPWWEKTKATAFSACKTRLNFRVWGQFEIKILIVRLINTTYFMCLKENWTWARDHLKSSNLSADNFKKTLELSGSKPEPAIRSGDTGQRIHCFDSCQLITIWMVWMYNIRLRGPKLARKCEIKHWYSCGAVCRWSGGRCTVTWLPNFLRLKYRIEPVIK